MKLTFVLVALLVLCAGLLAAGCGSSSDDGGETADQAQQEIQEQKDVAKEQAKKRAQQEIQEQKDVAAAQKAKAKQKAKDTKAEIQEQADVAAAQNAPGAKTDCGGGVQAGPNTSCSFAENVASKFKSTGQSSLSVYSPTTGETYTMNCGPWKDAGTVCKGGNNASVYITG